MADGDALHIARTKASSAVGFVRRHLKTSLVSLSAYDLWEIGQAGFQVRS
jgi:hypothetical protein